MNSCSPLLARELGLVEHLAPLRVAQVLLKERLYLPLALELRFAFEPCLWSRDSALHARTASRNASAERSLGAVSFCV